MTVSQEDVRLFFKLWLPLLQFASEAFDLHAGQLLKPSGNFNHAAANEVAEAIWSDISVIDDYLSLRTGLTEAERDIILGWKRAIHGYFAVERHLRGGPIFISLEDNRVYLVKGLASTWQELFERCPMPVIMTATLLPFKGVIITDGLFSLTNVTVGPNYREGFKDTYMAAKQEGRIIKAM